jgi:hypothetical protein
MIMVAVCGDVVEERQDGDGLRKTVIPTSDTVSMSPSTNVSVSYVIVVSYVIAEVCVALAPSHRCLTL